MRTLERMYERLGLALRRAREAGGLDQSQLAGRLGVGQQAVSTWERGRSRPRRSALREIAELLDLSVDELVEAGDYAQSTAPPSLPPRARNLPLGSLPSDRFEDLTVEILQVLHPEGHASRFGGPGEKQYGIDILVTSGDGGNRATAQCKRHEQFGAASVAAAVAAVTVEAARHYLFLSRITASPGARREIGKHANWELWDGEDISRYIRQLPGEQAVRIVDTYFPGHREAFLGIANPGPWLRPEDYFAQTANLMVSHDWVLVGRQRQLDELTTALFGPDRSLAIVGGGGGTGKTRLLRAFSESCPDKKVRVLVLPGQAAVDLAHFELLPNDRRLVVLIDDAHERDDLNLILSGIWRRNTDARLLLATRPYRWDAIRVDISRNTLAPENPVLMQLGDLLQTDAEALAREALGNQANDALVHQLASLTRDCPLVTVLGGVLINRRQLNPSDLGRDNQVRSVILRGYRDALVSNPAAVDPDTRDAVLNAVAALQPFRTGDETFRVAISRLVGKPYDVLTRHLRHLEETGILRRRGTSLRIIPDLLGDVILTQASYEESSQISTGYIDRVRSAADGQALQHLLLNVSRVDWQIRQSSGSVPSLVDSLWSPLEIELRSAGIAGRERLLGLLNRIAYYQPSRVLAIARWLIDNPTDVIEDDEAGHFYLRPPTYADVLYMIPPILRSIAYTFETLPDVLDLLWKLAQRDTRPPNQYPDHPERVLEALAQYEVGKPPEYNEAVIEAASNRFSFSGEMRLNPFEALEPLLATEGSRQTFQEYTLTFQPFPLNVDAVGPLRQRVIDLAAIELQSSDVKRAVAGVGCFEAALRYPNGMYGRPVTDEERDRWTPIFVKTIVILGTLIDTRELDPTVLVAVRAALGWHAKHSKTKTSSVATAVLHRLPDRLSDRVALVLHDGWGHLSYDSDGNFENFRERTERRLSSVAAELNQLPQAEVIELISQRLAAEHAAFGSDKGRPGPLIYRLIESRPGLALAFLELITSETGSPLDDALPTVLAAHAEHDARSALELVERLLARGESNITRAVAQALGWSRGRRALAPGERELLLRLSTDADALVRQAPVHVAQLLAQDDPAVACELLVSVDFSDDGRLANDVFMTFERPFGLNWEMLTDEQVEILRKRLIVLPDIDQHSITELLVERSAVDPSWVITLLQDRVSKAEREEPTTRCRPVPMTWSNALRVREAPSYRTHLRQLQAWIAAAPTSFSRRTYGAELFHEISKPYDEGTLALLTEALESGSEDDISAVIAIVGETERTFIWEHPEFVRSALHAAARFGATCRDDMARSFWGAAISGSRVGTPGKPFAEDVEQRDRSLALAEQMKPGSYEEKFYRDMAASAEHSISRTLEDDRPSDGRDW